MSTKSDRITIERVYDADLEDVWDLWTTKDGLESWWGPEGFTVTVKKLDLRKDGELLYDMIAAAPEMVAFMKQNGMPTITETRLRYTEVVPRERLAWITVADFVPGMGAYDVGTVLELASTPAGVRMRLTFDRMHDEEWTKRAVMGNESQLRKLEKLLASRKKA
jgi:uncharacterized protein YndB with AHSA1/START domain